MPDRGASTGRGAAPSRIENWTLAPGQTWWLVDSRYGAGLTLAHVAVSGRTLCGRRLPLSMAALTEKRMVCGSCERVLSAQEARRAAPRADCTYERHIVQGSAGLALQGDPVDGSGKSAPSARSGDALEAGDGAVTPGAPPAAAAGNEEG